MKTAKWILLVSSAIGIGYALSRRLGAQSSMGRDRYPRWRESFTDINSADAEALKKLGLDEVAAGRIVENRPYRNKLELVSRMVIPEKLYGTIRHRIGVRDVEDGIKVA
jgi:Helix-hairpin-helix motif